MMKKVFFALAAASAMFAASCQKQMPVDTPQEQTYGTLTVDIRTNAPGTKAMTSYSEVLAAEKAEKTVEVFVFDQASKRLEAYKKLTKTTDPCAFKLVSGQKIVYAAVNAQGLAKVKREDEFLAVVDDMSKTNLAANGLVMVGKTTGAVTQAAPLAAKITVSRLSSRIVLQRVTNNLPSMYGQITIDAVFVGNANTISTLGGAPSNMVNIDGYADAGKAQPIGKGDVTGLCANYLYKSLKAPLAVGAVNSDKHVFYCQPNAGTTHTRLYIVATVNGYTGYYPINLEQGLKANTTYTVEATLNNPPVAKPDDKFETGSVNVTITVADWLIGDNYEMEF